MILKCTLQEVLNNCNNWNLFCEQEGWSVYAVKEGGGDVEISLSIEDAKKYGLI